MAGVRSRLIQLKGHPIRVPNQNRKRLGDFLAESPLSRDPRFDQARSCGSRVTGAVELVVCQESLESWHN